MAQTAKLTVALQEVSRLKIAGSKGVRSSVITSPSENSYVKALARLLSLVSLLNRPQQLGVRQLTSSTRHLQRAVDTRLSGQEGNWVHQRKP